MEVRAPPASPRCADPRARVRYVIASVYGYLLDVGVRDAASFHSRRSSAYRAGMAASAKTPADPGAAPVIAVASNLAAMAGRPSRTFFADESRRIWRYAYTA